MSLVGEFVEAVAHTALWARGVYPGEMFERRSKYGTCVMMSRSPVLNKYLREVSWSFASSATPAATLFISLLDSCGQAVERYGVEVTATKTVVSEDGATRAEEQMRGCISRLKQVQAVLGPLLRPAVSFSVQLRTSQDASEAAWVLEDDAEDGDDGVLRRMTPLKSFSLGDKTGRRVQVYVVV